MRGFVPVQVLGLRKGHAGRLGSARAARSSPFLWLFCT